MVGKFIRPRQNSNTVSSCIRSKSDNISMRIFPRWGQVIVRVLGLREGGARMDTYKGLRWSVYRTVVGVCSLVCLATFGVVMGQDTSGKRAALMGQPVPMKDGDQEALPQPRPDISALPPTWVPPKVEPGEEGLPINLATALRLANVRALDIIIAQQQLGIAVAQLQQAQVLWLPNWDMGLDYAHHEGPIQNNDGSITNSTRSSMFVGGAPQALFGLTDAIFAPLAARQVARAQDANIQTATNDTLTAVAVAYFDAQEARADLASVHMVNELVAALVRKTDSLTPEVVPDVELARVRALQANLLQVEEIARRQWRLVSAELARVLRLNPTVVVEPMEPPQVRITLVSPQRSVDEMIPVALNFRPELTFTQAQAEAARERMQQERFRPFLPNLVLRGGTTSEPYPLGVGGFAGGFGGSTGGMRFRQDYDAEVIWELKNLGLGNLALIRERRATYELARAEDYRFRDLVAKEVAQAWAQLRAADRRYASAEVELKQAWISAVKNLEGLGQVKRAAGNINILVIRPLEVVAAMQALVTAYYDYYGTVADFNRAEFSLYRAMGNPAQALVDSDGFLGPPLDGHQVNSALPDAPIGNAPGKMKSP
jgi:outer membrane protein TolC